MLTYSAYGLTIASDLPLPEFSAAAPGARGDVRISLAPRAPFQPLPSGRWALEITPERVLFRLDTLGVFQIDAGRAIQITPTPEADLDLVRLYLIGTVMALLLHQRGMLALHAGSAAVGGVAAAFLGESGQGKSSLVAALQARGHQLVADDVTAVDAGSGTPLVVPAFPQLKLAPESAQALGQPIESLALLHLEEEKRGYRPAEGFAAGALPLGALYLLEFGPRLEALPVSPQEALIELVRHSYPTRLLHAGGPAHFRRSAQLVRQVPVYRLRRPHGLGGLAVHAAFVEEQLAALAARPGLSEVRA